MVASLLIYLLLGNLKLDAQLEVWRCYLSTRECLLSRSNFHC